jgi:AcrR family transcriptional regulator
VAGPAYTRLQVDERRRQLLEAGSRLFAEHSYEEISMREIAQAAGISKPLLYHYFPSKIELFKAAVGAHAAELERLITPTGEGPPLQQLTDSLDAYLGWIEQHAETWTKLMRSAATLPEAGELIESFRRHTLDQILGRLAGGAAPPPALRTALQGWLGFVDGAILDWTVNRDLAREQVRDLIVTAFGAALMAAQQLDPAIAFDLTEQ